MKLTWTRKDFANRLRDEVRRQGITFTVLARRSGIPDATLSAYATTGKHGRTPPIDAVRKIASTLRVPIDYLWPELPSEGPVYSDPRLASVDLNVAKLIEILESDNDLAEPMREAMRGFVEAVKTSSAHYMAPVEVKDAATAKRRAFVVMEVPATVKQPVGLLDANQRVVIVDFSSTEAPPYAHIKDNGQVIINTDPEGAVGRALWIMREVTPADFAQ